MGFPNGDILYAIFCVMSLESPITGRGKLLKKQLERRKKERGLNNPRA
jgi:hypothetical protein